MLTQSTVNLEDILALNLTEILDYALKQNHKDLQLTSDTVIQYKRYIYLCMVSTSVLAVPSQEVDEIWHAHLLHNYQYEQMCKTGGKVIYHQPTATATKTFNQALEDLKIEAIRYFGSPQAVGVGFSSGTCSECVSPCNDLKPISSKQNCSSCDNGCVACNGSDNGTIS